MRRAFFCLSVMLCFAALAVSAGCGKEIFIGRNPPIFMRLTASP